MKSIRRSPYTPAQIVGFSMFSLFALVALFAPYIAPYSPYSIDGGRLLPPSGQHLLGTNSIGQDLWSQLIYGTRTALIIALLAAALSTLLSVILGLLAGYVSKLDSLLNGLANMMLVLPPLLLILIIASFTGGGSRQLILTLGLLTWAGYMKLIRASVLSLKEREFVKASQLYNGSTWHILTKHIFPFIMPLIRTKFVMSFRTAIAMEATLSFLGIGDPASVSWGKMLQDAFSRTQTFITDAWQWMLIPPALAILLITVALALIGEGVTKKQQWAMSPAEQTANKQHELEETATAAPADAIVAVQQLTVTLGGMLILDQVNMHMKQGEITALIGESGSGKTTLARTIYGLINAKAVDGQVTVLGKNVYKVGRETCRAEYTKDKTIERWRDAAFIFQDPRTSFNPLMTIGAQMYEAMNKQLNKAEKQQIASTLLAEVQLEKHVLSCYPHELSGGMLSRAMIALALVNKPKLLIADEPTSALDPLVRNEVIQLLLQKVREYKMSLLFISHDVVLAEAIADSIVVLDQGKRIEMPSNITTGRKRRAGNTRWEEAVQC